MIKFEIGYIVGRDVYTLEMEGEHIGEVLDAAQDEMRRRHQGRGVVVGIRQVSIHTTVSKDGRRILVTVPGA